MFEEVDTFFLSANADGVARQISSLTFPSKVNRVYLGEKGSYYVKNNNNQQGIASIASCKMYNGIGIDTPSLQLLKGQNDKYTKTIEQDVAAIKGLVVTLASSDVEYTKIETKPFGKFKWELFYNEELEWQLLRFMTPSCLESLKNVFLADELRTDVDRRLANYFFYRTKGSKKQEGIITIDLEQMVIYRYCGTKKDDFVNFLYYPYQSATPQQVSDELCYMQRIRNIRTLIEDGVLSSSNIETLKNVIEYNFPQEFRALCKERKIWGSEKNKLVTPIERLWEYNHKTIGKDLGL